MTFSSRHGASTSNGPTWRLALPGGVQQIHTVSFGVQRHSPADASMRAAARASDAILQMLADAGVASVESFEVIAGHDMPGSRVHVASSTDVDAGLQRIAAFDLSALHASLGEWRDSIGLWREQFLTSVDRLETHYAGAGSPDHRYGLAHLPQSTFTPHADDRDPTRVTPDRSAASVDDALPSTVPFGFGEALSGYNARGLVHLRAGHDGSDCGSVEAGLRERGLQVLVDLGLGHLWRHPAETGSFGLRQSARVDVDGAPLAETSFAGFFRNRADLRQWTDEHAAHLSDFRRLLDQEGLAADRQCLRVYHEVSVIEPGDARFDYVNCGPRTGVIRFIDLERTRLRVRPDLA